MKNETGNDTTTLETQVRDAVEAGRDVQEKVRQLTLRMISSRSLDTESVRETAQAVLRGARAGMRKAEQDSAAQTGAAREHLKEAVNGLDVALAQFAEAAKLAVEEAASRTQKYSGEDLKRARADLANLETMFMDTLHSSASATRDAAGDILRDLAAHARVHGTAVGAQLKDTLAVFTRQMAAAGRGEINAGLHLARNTADVMRHIAAGALSGLADYLQPRKSAAPGSAQTDPAEKSS